MFSERDRPPPGDVPRHLQPLGVLVEHRVDDVDERLVAVEQPVAAGEQVAFEPALALVLAEHLHDPAVGGEVVVGRRRPRPPTACRSPRRRPSRRFEAVSSGPKMRKFRWSSLSSITSRRNLPSVRVSSFIDAAGPGDVDGVVAEVGQAQVAEQDAAVGVRVGPHPALALRGPARRVRGRAGPPRRTAPRAGSSASRFRAASGARGAPSARRAAPGGPGTSPRPAGRRRPSGPVQPLGVCRTIIGQRGRVGDALGRGRRPGSAGSRRRPRRASRPSAGASPRGRPPRRSRGCSRSPRRSCSSSSRPIRARTVGLAIL